MQGWLVARLRRVTETGRYRPEIDGLRFFAILPVILWHLMETVARDQQRSAPLSAQETAFQYVIPVAWTGVVLFFTISGFIIARQLLAQHESARPFSARHYYLRRVTRIEPPYMFVLIATFLVVVGVGYRPENMVAFWRAPESFTESLLASLFYLHGSLYNTMPRLFPGGWSLEVEVQFYLLAPLIFYTYMRTPSLRRRMYIGITALLAGAVFAFVLDEIFGDRGGHRYSLLKYFPYFWLGVLLADLHIKRRLAPLLSQSGWDIAGLLGLITFMISGIFQHFAEGWNTIVLDLVRFVAITAMFGGALGGRRAAAFCGSTWISIIGGACYSFYLTHAQILKIITPPILAAAQPANLYQAYAISLGVMVPVLLVAGFTFYVLIERPCMIPNWPTLLWNRLTAPFRSRPPVADESTR